MSQPQSFLKRRFHGPASAGSEITDLLFSTDGRYLLTGTQDFTVRAWGMESGLVELCAPPLAHSNDYGGYHSGKLSCDFLQARGERWLAAGSATGAVMMWNFSAGQATAELRDNGHEYGASVTSIAAFPDGRLFVSAEKTTIKVWSADTFECTRTLKNPMDVLSATVSANGKYLLCAGCNAGTGAITVWDGARGSRPLRIIEGHGRSVRSMSSPPDPDIVVTVGQDGRARVIDVTTGGCKRMVWLKGAFGSPIVYAALVNRGQWLLTSTDEGGVQIWSVGTGKCLVTMASSCQADTSKKKIARFTVSRCGRWLAVTTGVQAQVIDLDAIADHSRTVRGGDFNSYLRHVLRFVASPMLA